MAEVKQINKTTFSADGLGDVKPSIVIGGKDNNKFIPNINMSFHHDEFFININRKNKNAILAKDKNDDKAEILFNKYSLSELEYITVEFILTFINLMGHSIQRFQV